jgi:hypothetical protein
VELTTTLVPADSDGPTVLREKLPSLNLVSRSRARIPSSWFSRMRMTSIGSVPVMPMDKLNQAGCFSTHHFTSGHDRL